MMMKTKMLIRAALIICIAVSHINLYGQAKLAIYRVYTDPDDNSKEISEPYSCGSHFTQVVLPVNQNSTTHWILKNEGNAPLILNESMTISGKDASSFELINSPSLNIQPGELAVFSIKYTYSDFMKKSAFLSIKSNDPEVSNCGILIQGVVGNPSICYCFCNEDQELGENCPWEITGFKSGLSVSEVGCALQDDQICKNNLKLTSICSCDRLVSATNRAALYTDTLTITAGANARQYLTFNQNDDSSSFLDENGKSIGIGTYLGLTNSQGILIVPFYRSASTQVNIKVNGISLISADLCPSLADCTEPAPAPNNNPTTMESIPTLSEWGILLLTLALLVTSLVTLKSRLFSELGNN